MDYLEEYLKCAYTNNGIEFVEFEDFRPICNYCIITNNKNICYKCKHLEVYKNE